MFPPPCLTKGKGQRSKERYLFRPSGKLKLNDMSGNKNMRDAAKNKNDEFYTEYDDIQNELNFYKDYFKDKVVLCNCDDPNMSNFYKFFKLNFKYLGLKKLITTCYKSINPDKFSDYTSKHGTLLEYDGEKRVVKKLKGEGDFADEECVAILDQADVVVTNPPFSLFRKFIALLVEKEKDFLVIGNENSIICKDIFPLVKNNKIWYGNTKPKKYKQPDGTYKKFGNHAWYTNIGHEKRSEGRILHREYDPNVHPEIDNYTAIFVRTAAEIPGDYYGYMAVPGPSFLSKYNPEQFEIYGITNTGEENPGIRLPDTKHGRCLVNGKEEFTRMIIKRK